MNTMDAFEAGVSGVVGALQYNFDPSHQHWHYLALDRYDLRSHDSSLTEVARDQKTGFCLVQSAQINPTDCQHNNPSATAVSETINPGFSDIYDPARDGQYIDVTGLNGTYEFIQWVNADCRLADMGPAGHTWATVLQINATAGTPTVTVTSQTPLWNNYYAGPQQRREVPAHRDSAPGGHRTGPGGQHPLDGAGLLAPADGERVHLPVAPLRRDGLELRRHPRRARHRTTRRPTPTRATRSAPG